MRLPDASRIAPLTRHAAAMGSRRTGRREDATLVQQYRSTDTSGANVRLDAETSRVALWCDGGTLGDPLPGALARAPAGVRTGRSHELDHLRPRGRWGRPCRGADPQRGRPRHRRWHAPGQHSRTTLPVLPDCVLAPVRLGRDAAISPRSCLDLGRLDRVAGRRPAIGFPRRSSRPRASRPRLIGRPADPRIPVPATNSSRGAASQSQASAGA